MSTTKEEETTTTTSTINISLDPVSGTRDFYPGDMNTRNWLFDIWTKVSRQFGFSQYDAPVLENQGLYTRKGGDDITKEMYAFELDGAKLALRPEMTPSLARMVMNKFSSEITPFKWFSLPQCWRYETTTRGRKREHYQWNADILGGERIKSEVEILLMVISFFKSVKLTPTDVVLRISNRMILQKVLDSLDIVGGVGKDIGCCPRRGLADKFERACNIIDKIAKVTPEDFSKMLIDEIGLTQEGVDTIVKFSKITNLADLDSIIGIDDPALKEMKEIFAILDATGNSEWITFDASIVRGLSYYTGMVFEGFSKTTALKRSICGGGRYDELLTTYGYPKPVPACGFGFGDVVITEVLGELKLLPESASKIDYVVIPFNDSLYGVAVQVSQQVRERGFIVDTCMKTGKLSTLYNYADRIGGAYVILIAPDEWKDGKVVVKNLRETDSAKKQFIITVSELLTGF